MTNLPHDDFDIKTYFEEIGAWPHNPRLIYIYMTGFVFSIALTLAAFALATRSMLTPTVAIALAAFALVQFVVQVVCFLHLGPERRGRERLVVFACALFTVIILASGSLWIMFTLNSRMMPAGGMQGMLQYMNDQDGGI